MEDILKYENRDQLYKFLIDDFGLNKIEEKYDPENFGNFYIVLSAKEFFLSYINDRSLLTIKIASQLEPSNWYALSFIRDFIYRPSNINTSKRQLDNVKQIDELNDFLKKDFDLISDLFNRENYSHTKKQIERLLKEQFKKGFPGMLLE